MTENSDSVNKTVREKAAALIHKKMASIEVLSHEQIIDIIYDLQLHQVELEMQNDELRRTQEDLAISRDLYFQLFHLAPVGYVIVNHSGIILQANQTIADMLNVDLSILDKCPLVNFIFEEDKKIFLSRLKAFISKPTGKIFELRMVQSSGETIFVNLTGLTAETLLKSISPQSGILINIVDITERKQAVEEKMLREKLQGTLETAGAVCHELNQPLQIITGNIEMISYSLKQDNPIQKRIDKIKDQIKRISDITDKIFGITRCQSKAHDYATKILDLENSQDRRKEKRYTPSKKAYAIPASDFDKQNPIIDISLEGLSFWRDEIEESIDYWKESGELAVTIPDADLYLDKMPYRTISEVTSCYDSQSSSTIKKRRNVQFKDLTEYQRVSLYSFIRDHTKE